MAKAKVELWPLLASAIVNIAITSQKTLDFLLKVDLKLKEI